MRYCEKVHVQKLYFTLSNRHPYPFPVKEGGFVAVSERDYQAILLLSPIAQMGRGDLVKKQVDARAEGCASTCFLIFTPPPI